MSGQQFWCEPWRMQGQHHSLPSRYSVLQHAGGKVAPATRRKTLGCCQKPHFSLCLPEASDCLPVTDRLSVRQAVTGCQCCKNSWDWQSSADPGGLNRMILKVPSNPNHSRILWIFGLLDNRPVALCRLAPVPFLSVHIRNKREYSSLSSHTILSGDWCSTRKFSAPQFFNTTLPSSQTYKLWLCCLFPCMQDWEGGREGHSSSTISYKTFPDSSYVPVPQGLCLWSSHQQPRQLWGKSDPCLGKEKRGENKWESHRLSRPEETVQLILSDLLHPLGHRILAYCCCRHSLN